MQLPDLGLGPVPPPHVAEAIPYYKVMQNSLVGFCIINNRRADHLLTEPCSCAGSRFAAAV